MKNNYLSKGARLVSIVSLYLGVSGCGGGGGGSPEKVITNTQVVNSITNGTTSGAFTDIATYIDTKIPIEGGAVVPNTLAIDPAAKTVLMANFNAFLDTSHTPVFAGGSLAGVSGVAVDQGQRKITVTSGTMTVSWTFEANRVTRSLSDGAGLSSSYVYSTVGGQTQVSFNQSVSKTHLVASYSGSASLQLDTTSGMVAKVVSASFTQNHTETNSLDDTSNTVNGTVTMRPSDAGAGNLSFNGAYSVFIPGTGQVHGSIKSDQMTYLLGYKANENAYYNSNVIDAATVFTSATDYTNLVQTTNPDWLQGIWTASFSDGSAGSGLMQVSVTATTATWWGQSADSSRFYGTAVKFTSDSKMLLYDDTVLWGTALQTSDHTVISGTWTENGRSGSFTLSKQ